VTPTDSIRLLTFGPSRKERPSFQEDIKRTYTMAEDKKPKQGQLNIELTEDIAGGVYSNLCVITHSQSEFVLDFIRVMPGMPKAKVQSRIILTPQHAKRLQRALAENISRFENQHGDISEAGMPEIGLPMNFGGPTGEA
jgi:hypothetical protein